MRQDFSDDFRLRETAEREEFEQEIYTLARPTAYTRRRRLQEKDEWYSNHWTKKYFKRKLLKPRLPASAFRRMDWRVRSEWIRRRKRALGSG